MGDTDLPSDIFTSSVLASIFLWVRASRRTAGQTPRSCRKEFGRPLVTLKSLCPLQVQGPPPSPLCFREEGASLNPLCAAHPCHLREPRDQMMPTQGQPRLRNEILSQKKQKQVQWSQLPLTLLTGTSKRMWCWPSGLLWTPGGRAPHSIALQERKVTLAIHLISCVSGTLAQPCLSSLKQMLPRCRTLAMIPKRF